MLRRRDKIVDNYFKKLYWNQLNQYLKPIWRWNSAAITNGSQVKLREESNFITIFLSLRNIYLHVFNQLSCNVSSSLHLSNKVLFLGITTPVNCFIVKTKYEVPFFGVPVLNFTDEVVHGAIIKGNVFCKTAFINN